MDPRSIQLGPFAVRWYGLLIAFGAFVATWVAAKEAQRKGEDPEHAWNALFFAFFFGLVGARLYHVIDKWEFYAPDPIAIIAFWNGGLTGLGIYGAIAGGMLGMYIYTRWQKQSFLFWLDCAAPGMLLAQAIGRWGNYFNREAYGYPTDLPWGIVIEPQFRLPGYELFSRFHPTFLYEFIWNAAAAAILLYVARRYTARLKPGDMVLMYLIAYPAGRVWVEALRADSWTLGGLKTAQIIGVLAATAAAVVLIERHRRAAVTASPAGKPPRPTLPAARKGTPPAKKPTTGRGAAKQR